MTLTWSIFIAKFSFDDLYLPGPDEPWGVLAWGKSPELTERDLADARVDLRACVDTLGQLQGLRPHRYPISGAAMEMIKPLMDRSTS